MNSVDSLQPNIIILSGDTVTDQVPPDLAASTIYGSEYSINSSGYGSSYHNVRYINDPATSRTVTHGSHMPPIHQLPSLGRAEYSEIQEGDLNRNVSTYNIDHSIYTISSVPQSHISYSNVEGPTTLSGNSDHQI